MSQVRWNISVSAETDHALRLFLVSQGASRKGDLSRFIEEAVRAHIFALSGAHAKRNNVGVSAAELDAMVNEAVQWARDH